MKKFCDLCEWCDRPILFKFGKGYVHYQSCGKRSPLGKTIRIVPFEEVIKKLASLSSKDRGEI